MLLRQQEKLTKRHKGLFSLWHIDILVSAGFDHVDCADDSVDRRIL